MKIAQTETVRVDIACTLTINETENFHFAGQNNFRTEQSESTTVQIEGQKARSD